MKKNILQISTFTVILLSVVIMLSGCHAVESDTQGPLNNLNNFTAYNRVGEPFTQENFADYDLTIVLFWAPWSDASVYELKQLVALSDRLPDNVSFATVCLDSDLKESKTRLKELNLKGILTLVEGDGDFKVMSDAIVNVPTTIIVDSAGNLIGDPVIGIQEDYEKAYVKLLNKAMKKVGGEKINLKEAPKESKKNTEDETGTEETEDIEETEETEEADGE